MQQRWNGGAGAFSSGSIATLAASRLIVQRQQRDWHQDVMEQLKSLTSLERGWNGYGAPPVSFDTAHFAVQMLETICPKDVPAPQIVPGSNGDLQIEWHTAAGDVELHVKQPYKVEAWRLNDATGEDGETLALTNDFTTVGSWIREAMEPVIASAAAA